MQPRDEAKMRRVVEEYQGMLLRFAARVTGNPASAEDIVQRAFIKCAGLWKGEMEPSEQLCAWLYRVVHNEALDEIRAERRRTLLHARRGEEMANAGEDVQPPPEEESDDVAAVRWALGRLKEKERNLITLKVYEEKSYREIAQITGMSESNVGVSLHNAMKKLAVLAERRRRGDGK